MRFALAFVYLVLASCQTCPDGNATNSLFCHGADCADGESVCAGACANLDSDRDNCGSCGNACGDGLVCSFGQCVEGCDNGLVRCGDVCVDVTSDPENCMTCGTTCSAAQEQSCNNGVCGCAVSEITCGGVCTDPETDRENCGASGDCLGANAGEACAQGATCIGGECLFATIYRGSLPASTGRWTYTGVLGIDGANADCELHFTGSAICPIDKLMLAQAKGELVNAVDYNNVPVAEWWVDDPNGGNNSRCTSNADAIPWSYQTADEGHVGKFVVLTPAAGTIGPLTEEGLPSCNKARNVACCSINIQP